MKEGFNSFKNKVGSVICKDFVWNPINREYLFVDELYNSLASCIRYGFYDRLSCKPFYCCNNLLVAIICL